MSLEKVQQALLTQLTTGFPTWANRIAFENKAFSAPKGQPWLAFFFMPVGENIRTLGANGFDEANGLAQIDVNYPEGFGESDSRKTIELLRTCYKPGYLLYAGQSVSILSRSRASGMPGDGFYKIPFTVRWRAQLTR